ncbi:hypothetical protein [Streptomyces sp. NBC_00063]|uniref:hypothetical protein n=1 Tax=Streptomyces sp. NBC_00063 TaxID=2975638 RepID=UPI003D75468C
MTRDHKTRRAVAGGRDIYAVTAPFVVEPLTRLLRGDRAVTGVVAVGEAFDIGCFLRALGPDHLTHLGLPAGVFERGVSLGAVAEEGAWRASPAGSGSGPSSVPTRLCADGP